MEKHPKRKFDGGQTCVNNADMITSDEMESLEERAVGLMEEYTTVEKIEAAVQSKTFSRCAHSFFDILVNFHKYESHKGANLPTRA